MSNIWLHRYCIVLAIATLLLVIVGVLVTSDRFVGAHRVVASSVGMLTIGLVVWLWRAEKRRWMRRLGLAALLLVILQGALGALSLRLGLPPSIAILHACLAQLYFSLAVALVLFTSVSWGGQVKPVEDTGWPPLRHLAALLPVAVLGQLALGAGYRHKVLGLMPHVMGALVVTGLVLMAAMIALSQHQASKPLAKAAKRLLIITLHQVPLGVLAYFLSITIVGGSRYALLAVATTVLHVAVGALLMAWSVLFAVQVRRTLTKTAPAQRRV